MVCDQCGVNQATIRLMTIVNGAKQEKNLCGECMARMKEQFASIDLSSIAGLLGGFLQVAQNKAAREDGREAIDITCSHCGTTYEQFQKTGFLGCAQCYQDFREPLEVLLKRVHGHTQHTGRVPGGPAGDVSIKLEIDRLKQKLIRAISEEAYEEAARLRDQIRSLRAQLEEFQVEPVREPAGESAKEGNTHG